MNVKAGTIESFYASYYERKVNQLKERYQQGNAQIEINKKDNLASKEQTKTAVKDLLGGDTVEVTLSDEGKRRYEALQQSSIFGTYLMIICLIVDFMII